MAKPGKKINYAKQQRRQMKQAQSEVTIAGSSPAPDSSNDTLSLQLHALDTWFFRESRPHDAAGASELSSLFPPPIRTLAGALRSFLGEQLEVDWNHLPSDFAAALGGADDLGPLQLHGPWIVHNGQRLYPAPLYLMQKEKDIQRLSPGKPVHCDLGKVRLPELAPGFKGYKTLEQAWLTAKGLEKCLAGETPDSQDIIKSDQLFSHEARLGIARNNLTRNVIEGKLYQTRHLRLHEDLQDGVHLALDVKNLPPELRTKISATQSAILRLGGEGRMASVTVNKLTQTCPELKVHQIKAEPVKRILIHFITPADFNGLPFPAEFKIEQDNGQTIWQGQLNGIALSIEAAVIGKAHREGGWDMQKHQPRPVKSYIPAGSAWFCRLDEHTDWQTLSLALNGQCIGVDTAFGRGQILLGVWQDTLNTSGI